MSALDKLTKNVNKKFLTILFSSMLFAISCFIPYSLSKIYANSIPGWLYEPSPGSNYCDNYVCTCTDSSGNNCNINNSSNWVCQPGSPNQNTAPNQDSCGQTYNLFCTANFQPIGSFPGQSTNVQWTYQYSNANVNSSTDCNTANEPTGTIGTSSYKGCGTPYANNCSVNYHNGGNYCVDNSNKGQIYNQDPNTNNPTPNGMTTIPAPPYPNVTPNPPTPTNQNDTAHCSEAYAYQDLCGSPINPPTTDSNNVCANNMPSGSPQCGQIYLDQCYNTLSYPNAGSSATTHIHNNINALSQKNPLDTGAACEASDADMVNNVPMSIVDNNNNTIANNYVSVVNGNLSGTLSANVVKYDFVNPPSSGTYSFKISTTAPDGLQSADFFITAYHDNNGDGKTWTEVNDFVIQGGNGLESPTNSPNVVDNSFGSSIGSGTGGNPWNVYNNGNPLSTGTTTMATMPVNNSPGYDLQTLMNKYRGDHVAIVWGVKVTNMCDGVTENTINGSTLTNNGSADVGNKLNGKLNAELQVIIFNRAPEALALYTASRPNTKAGQGGDTSSVWWDISGNAVFNYYNQALANGGSIPFNKNGVPLPILNNLNQPDVGSLPKGMLSSAARGEITPITLACAFTDTISNKCSGYGPSNAVPDVGNPVNYVSYFRDLDGVNDIKTLVVGFYPASGGVSSTISSVHSAMVVVGLSCASGCNNTTFPVRILSTASGCSADANGNGCDIKATATVTSMKDPNATSFSGYPDRGDTVLKVVWNIEYDLDSSITNPDGVSYFDLNKGFGDGEYLMLSADTDGYSYMDGDAKTGDTGIPDSYEYTSPHSQVIYYSDSSGAKLYFQLMDNVIIAGGGTITVPDPSDTSNHFLLSDWIVLITPPKGYIYPDDVDPKHVQLTWCGFTSLATNPGCS